VNSQVEKCSKSITEGNVASKASISDKTLCIKLISQDEVNSKKEIGIVHLM
jgi:hypothetical protein